MSGPSSSDLAAVMSQLQRGVDRAAQAREGLSRHVSQVEGYVAWSGGRDSTAAVVLAQEVSPGIPVVWFHSGLEFPETEQYISEVAEFMSLNLHVIRADPDALTLLRETGAWDHGAPLREAQHDMHEALVAAPSRQAHQMFGPGEISGLRAEESRGRRFLLSRDKGHYVRQDGSEVFCPVWQWSALEIAGLLHREGIPENPVYEKLASLGAPPLAQRVGLVVDGNGVTMGRLTWLRVGWPEMFADLAVHLPRLREWR